LPISALDAGSGVVHNYLYIHGYNDIPMVGPAFLLQAGMFCALAVLILAGPRAACASSPTAAVNRRWLQRLLRAAEPEPQQCNPGRPVLVAPATEGGWRVLTIV
jgi:hypothetical protein